MKNRRKFLNQLIAGSGALMATPLLANVSNKKINMQKIKKVRSLGFQWETLDPFLFCVHHEDHYPMGNDKMGPASSLKGRNLGNDFHIKDGWRMYHGKEIPGFPGHPHRGFETLTVVRTGMVDHSDSIGGLGRYGNGDLQWMTAGKGLLHSEMFPLINKDKENPLELFQIWLNLPAKSKMVEPDYKMFWNESIPKFEYKGAYVEVLAGELFGKKSPTPPTNSWANDKNNVVGVYNIVLPPNTALTIPATKSGANRSLYYYQGKGLTVENRGIPDYHAVDVISDKDITLKSSEETVKILILQGMPINEPVVQHGPFVMNTRDEIQQAFAEYQKTQFGGWPHARYDHVHDRSKGRFAKYPSGKEEIKG